jgi:hypothetical protein
MSHIVVVKTKVQDVVAIAAAGHRLGLIGCFAVMAFRALSGTDEAASFFRSACVRAEAAGSASSSARQLASSSH